MVNLLLLSALKRKQYATGSIPRLIPFTAEVYDFETLAKLNDFWLYVNDKKLETDSGQIRTGLVIKKPNTVRYYAVPTQAIPYFRVPEDYIITTKRISTDTFAIKLTAYDEQNNPLQYADVTVEYNGNAESYQTDENGYVEILGLPKKTEITLTIAKEDYTQKTILFVK